MGNNISKKKISNVFIIIGIIGVFDSLLLTLVGVGINVGTIFPGIVGVALITLAVLLQKEKLIFFMMKKTLLKRIISALFGVVLISFLFIEVLILSSIKSDSNEQVDYLIILGAGLRGEEMTLTLSNRAEKGLEFLKNNPNVKVIVSGGQGLGETITEAEALRRYLVRNGIAEDRIIKEEKSTSTMENFKFSKETIDNENAKEKYKIMIATNGFHMFRAKMIAKRNGFQPYGLPAKTWWVVLPNSYIREYFAVIKSFFMDK